MDSNTFSLIVAALFTGSFFVSRPKPGDVTDWIILLLQVAAALAIWLMLLAVWWAA